MKDEKLENEVFEEEINADSIVVTKEKKKKSGFIFALIGFVLILCLGFYLLFRFGIISFSSKQYISGNLFVVHSNVNFGDTISSFEKYTTYDSAYSYTFYVENDNKDEYLYKIKLKNIDSDGEISYAILKNSDVLFKGQLDDSKETILTTQSILPSRTDNYELKLWSTDSSVKLQFKIDVES